MRPPTHHRSVWTNLINVRAPVPPDTNPGIRDSIGWWTSIAGAPELERNPPNNPRRTKKKKFGEWVRCFADGEDWRLGLKGVGAD